MNIKTLMLTSLLSVIVLSACSSKGYAGGYANSTTYKANSVVSLVDTSIGKVFATANGKTLYTFKVDEEAKSHCYDGCSAIWIPFEAQKNAKTWGEFTVNKRDDGILQWAYKNQPLYTWSGDSKKGDTKGNGAKNVWFALLKNQ
ncbi:COG4315 family predicted lipoprotein [Marinomonas transparens]|uniref:Lipoprotein with Yx(FWY)xxD motif n=1 Tax=Marinomonas transparens TaxID=2795388 RepID=A0A934JIV7_9GAMM|nr:hypothetical protein [Marinomonas transparens]MBJ7536880.1 hypothetical protein [Marinomonas transparens]